MRSSVVFPDPDGPSRPMNSLSWICRLTRSSTVRCSKRLVKFFTAISKGDRSLWVWRFHGGACFEHCFKYECREGHHDKKRSHREGSDEVEIVVEHLDVERHGVGKPHDVPRHHGDCSKLTDGATIAKQNAV